MLKFQTILLIVSISACSSNSIKPIPKENKSSTIHVPKYLADANNTLDGKVQKLELEYIVWGCACANWITPKDYKKYEDSGLPQHCIFIESADTTKNFPDSIFQFDINNIIVTGQFYIKEDYPKGTYEIEEPLGKAKVFRYTELKIVNKNR